MSEHHTDVVPSLMEVLAEAVEAAGKDDVDMRPLTRTMRKDGRPKGSRQVQRYLQGEGAPPSGELDEWARIVASVTPGRDAYEYWQQAIERAADAARARRAEEAVQDAGEEIRKARETESKRRSPKGKTG